MVILQIVSLSDWTEFLFALQDSESPWVWAYMLLLICCTSFGMLNIVVAVIVHGFAQTQHHYDRRDKDPITEVEKQSAVVVPVLVNNDVAAVEEARMVAMRLRVQGVPADQP